VTESWYSQVEGDADVSEAVSLALVSSVVADMISVVRNSSVLGWV
jgi:hypothetical protein